MFAERTVPEQQAAEEQEEFVEPAEPEHLEQTPDSEPVVSAEPDEGLEQVVAGVVVPVVPVWVVELQPDAEPEELAPDVVEPVAGLPELEPAAVSEPLEPEAAAVV